LTSHDRCDCRGGRNDRFKSGFIQPLDERICTRCGSGTGIDDSNRWRLELPDDRARRHEFLVVKGQAFIFVVTEDQERGGLLVDRRLADPCFEFGMESMQSAPRHALAQSPSASRASTNSFGLWSSCGAINITQRETHA